MHHKSWRINGKGTAFVTGGRWHTKTISAHRSNQWIFDSRKAKNPHFGSSKNLIKVLLARLAIAHGLTGNKITTGTNQYRFIQTLLDGEALRIFDLKWTKLRHEDVATIILVMDHVVT